MRVKGQLPQAASLYSDGAWIPAFAGMTGYAKVSPCGGAEDAGTGRIWAAGIVARPQGPLLQSHNPVLKYRSPMSLMTVTNTPPRLCLAT